MLRQEFKDNYDRLENFNLNLTKLDKLYCKMEMLSAVEKQNKIEYFMNHSFQLIRVKIKEKII